MTIADWIALGIVGVALAVSLYQRYRQRASARPNWGVEFKRQAGDYP